MIILYIIIWLLTGTIAWNLVFSTIKHTTRFNYKFDWIIDWTIVCLMQIAGPFGLCLVTFVIIFSEDKFEIWLYKKWKEPRQNRLEFVLHKFEQ